MENKGRVKKRGGSAIRHVLVLNDTFDIKLVKNCPNKISDSLLFCVYSYFISEQVSEISFNISFAICYMTSSWAIYRGVIPRTLGSTFGGGQMLIALM